MVLIRAHQDLIHFDVRRRTGEKAKNVLGSCRAGFSCRSSDNFTTLAGSQRSRTFRMMFNCYAKEEFVLIVDKTGKKNT